MSDKVACRNPLSRNKRIFPRRQAELFVSQGRAKWDDRKCRYFRFVDDDHRNINARMAAAEAHANYDRDSRLQPLPASRNLPMLRVGIAYGLGESGPTGGRWIASLRGVYARPTPEAM